MESALDAARAAYEERGFFPGLISLRYAQGTQALLGFTRFEPTCLLEVDGLNNASTNRYLEALWKRLRALNIRFTTHWGKVNLLDRDSVRSMYGGRLTKWIRQRKRLLDPETRPVFESPLMTRLGLI